MKPLHLVSVVVAATLSLSACVVAPVPSASAYYGEPVMVAPPAPRVEYVGPPPTVGYVWIGGYWNWFGGRHVWVPGRWEAPRHGHVWVAPVGTGWKALAAERRPLERGP